MSARNKEIPELGEAYRHTSAQPSPEHFSIHDGIVYIPEPLMYQMHRYDLSSPTGGYVGRMFLRWDRLMWVKEDDASPTGLSYDSLPYRVVKTEVPDDNDLAPCPLCNGKVYGVFSARAHGDNVRYTINCDCEMSFGGQNKLGLESAVNYSHELAERWNASAGRGKSQALIEAATRVVNESNAEYAIFTMSEIACMSEGFESALRLLDEELAKTMEGLKP